MHNMGGEVIEYKFWQDDDLLSLKQRHARLNYQKGCRYLYLETHVRYKTKANNHNDDEYYVMIDFAKRGYIFLVSDYLLRYMFRSSKETSSLSDLGVPRDFVVETLAPGLEIFVRNMESEPRNAGHEFMGFVLAIDVLVRSIEHNEMARDTRRDVTRLPYWRRDIAHAMRPDFELLSIDDEEYVDDNKEEERDVCAICLEKPALEDRFVRLDCSHSYHCSCIVESVYRGHNLCPLCRRRIQSCCHEGNNVPGLTIGG